MHQTHTHLTWTLFIVPSAIVSDPLLSMERIMFHCLYQWGELCPIIDVSERNIVPLLISVGGIMPNLLCQWKGIVLNPCCQREKQCTIVGVS